MTNNQGTKTISSLFNNPSELINIISNPGKNGLDFYKSLTQKDKQNLAFATGIGFIIYGFLLMKNKV